MLFALGNLTLLEGPAVAIVGSRDHSPYGGEVARALAGGDDGPWRPLMGRVRQAAMALARQGRVEILRKGKPVPPVEVRGVIRLRQPGPGGPEGGEPA